MGLTKEQITILEAIQSKGLTVLWSFRSPTPKYDNQELMSRWDWVVLYTELMKHPIRHVVAPDGTAMEFEAEESDWIVTRKMPRDEHFEEFVGILYRYTLSEKAISYLKSLKSA